MTEKRYGLTLVERKKAEAELRKLMEEIDLGLTKHTTRAGIIYPQSYKKRTSERADKILRNLKSYGRGRCSNGQRISKIHKVCCC